MLQANPGFSNTCEADQQTRVVVESTSLCIGLKQPRCKKSFVHVDYSKTVDKWNRFDALRTKASCSVFGLNCFGGSDSTAPLVRGDLHANCAQYMETTVRGKNDVWGFLGFFFFFFFFFCSFFFFLLYSVPMSVCLLLYFFYSLFIRPQNTHTHTH